MKQDIPHNRAEVLDGSNRFTRDWYDYFRRIKPVSAPTNVQQTVINNSQFLPSVTSAVGYDEGTSFPSTPASGDKFYRTDLNWLCFYDGTRWLTVHEYLADFANQQALQPITTQSYFASVTLRRDYGVYLTRFHGSYYIGPTNNGSNYRTLNLVWGNSTSSETTLYTTDSSAAAASTNIDWSIAINSVISSSAFYLAINNTRTGLPSGLYGNFAIAYRLVVT